LTFQALSLKILNMKVILTKHFDRYVNEKIASGRYESPSEIIREALRLMEECEQREEPPSLQAKITAGFETPLRRVTAAGWRDKWAKGVALAEKVRRERRRAA
jgi:putative addiction module CopG family antidote